MPESELNDNDDDDEDEDDKDEDVVDEEDDDEEEEDDAEDERVFVRGIILPGARRKVTPKLVSELENRANPER